MGLDLRVRQLPLTPSFLSWAFIPEHYTLSQA